MPHHFRHEVMVGWSKQSHRVATQGYINRAMLNEKLCIMCTRLNDKAKIFEDE